MIETPASIRKLANAPLARQLARFTGVGVVGTIVHYGVLIAAVELLHLDPVIGTILGFLCAAFVSYVLNRRYTFTTTHTFRQGLLRYYGALAVGLVINAGTVWLLTHWGTPYILAQAVATGLAFIWNFIAARFVVFQG
ncbi:MAG: GtrA family protein [Caulobacterales bacterium]